MADINTKYTYVLEAVRADGKKVMRFTNKPENKYIFFYYSIDSLNQFKYSLYT